MRSAGGSLYGSANSLAPDSVGELLLMYNYIPNMLSNSPTCKIVLVLLAVASSWSL